MEKLRVSETPPALTRTVAPTFSRPGAWGRTVTSMCCMAPTAGSRNSTLCSDSICSPSPGWNESSMESISSPGACTRDSSTRSTWPTSGGSSSRNFRLTGVVDATALTALTMSASVNVSAGVTVSARAAARASCCARAWSVLPPQPDASATAPRIIARIADPARTLHPILAARHSTMNGPCSEPEHHGTVQDSGLFHQVAHVLVPESGFAKPGERPREGRVGPALGDPGRMVEHAHGAQHFDEARLAMIDAGKALVPGQQLAPLPSLLVRIAGQEHPQILDRRTVHAVVEVHEHRTLALPQNIAKVTVAVQTDLSVAADVRGPDVREQFDTHTGIALACAVRKQIGGQDGGPGARAQPFTAQ